MRAAENTPSAGTGFAVLVPAYKPPDEFVDFVRLLGDSGAEAVVIVDDGSGPEYAACFARLERIPRVHLLRHAVNLGKGSALKTGINYCLCTWPELAGVVTADADGQHAADDVLRVGRCLLSHTGSLTLGTRHFNVNVPFRSRLGNKATMALVRLLIGQRISDTQTGLRAIPTSLLPHLLKIGASGYDFELEMLITAKHLSFPLREEKVRTIYLHGNRGSHFNPLFDSMRIYFVLLRFSTLSLLTALLDNAVFVAAFQLTGSIGRAQILGRLVAILFNYASARRIVFLSRQSHRILLPRYLLLVLASALLSYSLIRLFISVLSMEVILAKLLAEGLIFIANFTIQRDFVFTKRASSETTNWDEYYAKVPFTAHFTRKYTGARLVSLLRKIIDAERGSHPVLVEIGGANSCFVEQIQQVLKPRRYYVIDTNLYGLRLLENRIREGSVCLLNENVLDLHTKLEADVVFSVGLIEHFNPPETRRAVLAHFELLRPGGYAVLSFPTPTILYRVARSVCEIAGLWKFPDERPLDREEVLGVVKDCGQLIHEELLWPLVFTQQLLIVRKYAAGASKRAALSV